MPRLERVAYSTHDAEARTVTFTAEVDGQVTSFVLDAHDAKALGENLAKAGADAIAEREESHAETIREMEDPKRPEQ
jgi:hypothetical protein